MVFSTKPCGDFDLGRFFVDRRPRPILTKLSTLCVRARGADGHLGIDKGLAGVCPAISVVTAT
jgi:hypothetical protein